MEPERSMSCIPIEETITKRSTPSSRAASTHLTARAEVDGLLALRPAAGPGARGEHDRLRAADVRAQVVVLEIAEHGDGAVGLEVGGVVGVADQPAGVVAVGGEDSVEPAGDLSVASGDEDVHGVRRTQVTAASTTRPPVICVADSA